MGCAGSCAAGDAEAGAHFLVQEAATGMVGLDPFTIDDKLGDGTLADVGEDLFDRAWSGLNINLGVGDAVGIEEAFGLAAITAPGC